LQLGVQKHEFKIKSIKSWINVQNYPFSESIFKIHVICKVEAIEWIFCHILLRYSYFF